MLSIRMYAIIIYFYVCRLYDFVSTGNILEYRYSGETILEVNQNEGYSMIYEENEEVEEEEDDEMEKGNNNIIIVAGLKEKQEDTTD